MLTEAFLGLDAEHFFHGRVHEDDITCFVDDLDRVAADLGDDAIALFALAKRLARPLDVRLRELLLESVEFGDEFRPGLLGVIAQRMLLPPRRPADLRAGLFSPYTSLRALVTSGKSPQPHPAPGGESRADGPVSLASHVAFIRRGNSSKAE